MKYNETLKYIHSLGFFSHTAGLDRIKKVMQKLNDPQNDFKSIHIAGTNGKGSVCAFVSSVLISAGYSVGSFTSPYITDFCERIQLNGKNIGKTDLCRLSQKVIDTNIELTEFEFITAVGFLYFSEKKADVAVIETGLGGRFDATNIIPPPLVSVITKIGFDHTAVLGDTLQKIATEKCGIIKNENVVTGYSQPKEALSVIKKYAPQAVIPDINKLKIIKTSVLGNEFIYKNVNYKTDLGGSFQIENSLIAIETIKKSNLVQNEKDIVTGLKNAFIPARTEVVSKSPLIIIDGAHNPDGADALAQILGQHKDCTAIIGVMKDKDYKKVLSKTLPFCKNAICVKPSVPRALPTDKLCITASEYCKNVFVAQNIADAVKIAKEKAQGEALFVFGSLYLASEIRGLLKDK